MSLLLAQSRLMSAFGGKADMEQAIRNVCF